jgi:HK97 family phage major capsid protein
MAQIDVLGRPMVVSEFLPALNTRGDLMAADLSKYAIVDFGMAIDASLHHAFAANTTAFRVTHLVSGMTMVNTTLTLDNGQAASAFVALEVGS